MSPLAADPLQSCDHAGPGATFCAEALFKRLDVGQTDGISLWLHQAGYLSKLVVQKDLLGRADRGLIEAQIMAMVSSQAGRMGRDFAFADAESDSYGGVPFGTLSYSFAGTAGDVAILHSYVVANGIVVQMISQIGLERASRDPAALAAAHADALGAFRLAQSDPEA